MNAKEFDEIEKEYIWAKLQLPEYVCDRVVEDDTLYTIAEFRENVEDGGFIDYDGMGSWANKWFKDSRGGEHWVKPSRFLHGIDIPPVWATHVVWYNR